MRGYYQYLCRFATTGKYPCRLAGKIMNTVNSGFTPDLKNGSACGCPAELRKTRKQRKVKPAPDFPCAKAHNCKNFLATPAHNFYP